MLTDSELASVRATYNESLTDTCQIREPGGTQGEFDPETGTYPSVLHTPYYDDVCRAVVTGDSTALERIAAEQQVSTHPYAVVVPWSVTAVEVGHIVKMTASRDPRLVGRELRVEDIQGGSYAAARRLLCTDNLG